MRTRHYSSQGIILSRKNYSEADRIIVILTKSSGKIKVIAKGVRKLASRKRGSLEVFSLIRFSASKGKNLDILTEVDGIESFSKVRKNIKKVVVAYYLIEVTNRLLREELKSEETFDLLYGYLKKLESANSLRQLRLDYVYDILVQLGFWPKSEKINNPDQLLEEILETKLNTRVVGKRILS